MRVTYANSTKKGSKADPRFTIVSEGMPTFGDAEKARPVVEIEAGEKTLRIVMPRNVYIPGGHGIDSVSFDVSDATVTHSAAPDVMPFLAPTFTPDMAIVAALGTNVDAITAYLLTAGATPDAAGAMAAAFAAG